MANPILAGTEPLESPLHDACESPLHDMQGPPSRYYQATWSGSPACDFVQPWNGLLFWDRVSLQWFGSLNNTIEFRIDLTRQATAEDKVFDIVNESGTPVSTTTIHVEKGWLLRFREFFTYPNAFIDHWYAKAGGWTPAGVYTLLLNASPDDTIIDPPRLSGPYTLKPTQI